MRLHTRPSGKLQLIKSVVHTWEQQNPAAWTQGRVWEGGAGPGRAALRALLTRARATNGAWPGACSGNSTRRHQGWGQGQELPRDLRCPPGQIGMQEPHPPAAPERFLSQQRSPDISPRMAALLLPTPKVGCSGPFPFTGKPWRIFFHPTRQGSCCFSSCMMAPRQGWKGLFKGKSGF